MNRRIFAEKEVRSVKWQIAVHFIGRYLMITFYSVFFGRIQKYLGSEHIGLYKDSRVCDGTIHVAFRCKVHNYIRAFFFKQIHNKFTICDITTDKFIIWLIFNRFQCFEVSGISQKIEINDLVVRIFIHHVMYKVTSDKSGTAGYNNFHRFVSSIFLYLYYKP